MMWSQNPKHVTIRPFTAGPALGCRALPVASMGESCQGRCSDNRGADDEQDSHPVGGWALPRLSMAE